MKPTVENTRRIFAIFDPNMFPTDKFAELFKTASTETSSSEIDVPNPIITNPMKKSETLNFFPILTELATKTSAPFIAKKRPTSSVMISIYI